MQKYPNESFWRKQVQEWKQSGLGQSAYCRDKGIPVKSFSRWKIKLAIEVSKAAHDKTSNTATPLTLVSVQVEMPALGNPSGVATIALHRPGGWQVKVKVIPVGELGELLGKLP